MTLTMLLQLARRNLFRNRRRTLLTTLLIAMAVNALVVADTYKNGMINNVIEDAVKTSGHLRIQHPKFTSAERALPIQYNITGYSRLKHDLQALLPAGSGISGQIHFPAVLYGPEKNTVGLGFALEPAAAGQVLELNKNIAQGRMMAGGQEVVLGKELAQKLQVQPGDTVSVLAKSQYGSFSGINLTVAGIADLGFAKLNKIFYLPLATAQEFLEMEDQVTHILIMLADPNAVGRALEKLRESHALSGYDVIPYTDNFILQTILPIVKGLLAILLSFFVIIGVLGIVNTMSMAVMERTHELAVLSALGLRQRHILAMVLFESGLIGFIGSLIGVTAGLLLSWYLAVHGIVLNETATGLPIAVKSVVYGQLNPLAVVRSFLIGTAAALASAYFPARKATQIDPAAAMRL